MQNTPALSSTNEELGTNTIFLQAEDALYKTASTLYATYDRTTYMTSPNHPTKQRYNTIGQATWSKATQAITYNFKVENDGYYRFNFKARQNQMRGFFSTEGSTLTARYHVRSLMTYSSSILPTGTT